MARTKKSASGHFHKGDSSAPKGVKEKGKAPQTSKVPKEKASKDKTPKVQPPFPIDGVEEKKRFLHLHKVEFQPALMVNKPILEDTMILNRFMELIGILHWTRFIEMPFPSNHAICMQFFTTLKWKDEKKETLMFRFQGDEYELTHQMMHDLFGFKITETIGQPSNFSPHQIWQELTGITRFNPKNSSNKLIVDPCYLYLHKYLAMALFGRVENTKVQIKDLFVLQSILNGDTPDTITIIFDALHSISRSVNKKTLGMGYMVYGIVWSIRNPERTFKLGTGEVVKSMDLAYLKKSGLIQEDLTGIKWLERKKRRVQGIPEAEVPAEHSAVPEASSSRPPSQAPVEEEGEAQGWKQAIAHMEAMEKRMNKRMTRMEKVQLSIKKRLSVICNS